MKVSLLSALASAWLLSTIASCSSGSGKDGTTIGNGSGSAEPLSPEEQKRRDALARLRTRQDATCESLGPRITECSIADARATMTPEELAELDLENTAPKHTADFIDQCKGADYSPRQVRVMEVCQAEETECAPMLSCLDNMSGEAP
jgi:hypothetical protein